MTVKEKLIMELIRENPSVSQDQLAKKAGMSRAAVSVHISNLMKKGYIAGRGYILDEAPFVCVLGGANIDIIGHADGALQAEDSNPGKVYTSPGGVGRNIAENLARMGADVKLISAIGSDTFGKQTYEETRAAGVDMQHAYIDNENRHSSYLAILDQNGELKMGVSDMEMIDCFSLQHIQQKRNMISRAAYVVLDCNLDTAALEMVLDASRGPVYLDAVSAAKAARARSLIGRFDTIKVNCMEAQVLTGLTIDKNSEADWSRAVDGFLATGVRRVILTLGRRGIFWKSRESEGFIPGQSAPVNNATGAGDSFTASLVYAAFRGLDDDRAVHVAQYIFNLTLQSEFSVSRDITPSRMKRLFERAEANREVKE